MHTCKVSVRDLVEFILRSGDIVSSSTGIRDTCLLYTSDAADE